MGKTKQLFQAERAKDANNPVWGIIDKMQKEYHIEPDDVDQEITPVINKINKECGIKKGTTCPTNIIINK